MDVRLRKTLRHSVLLIAVPLAVYALFLSLAVIPFFQRQ